MAGHLGQENVTSLNLTVFRVDVERGLILLKGAVPGAEGGYVKIRDAIKHPAPKGVPTPGGIKQTAQPEPDAPEAAEPAAEAQSGGEDQ
jgi:large subunit ribosomal protein L3